MILIVIPAKETSSRLPGKNMLPINGSPMIDYAIAAARASKRIGRIVVSTDSDEIAEHCRTAGIEVVRRGPELGGDAPLFDVYKHAALAVGLNNIDIIVGLQVDHPDRLVGVDEALDAFESQHADYLTSSDASGKVNGSYKIYARRMLETKEPRKHVVLVDNCTNIHYAEDLDRAAHILSRMV